MSDTKRKRGLPSGRFVLRISHELHRDLQRAAQAAGLSLNEYCARKLAQPLGGGDAGGVEAVRRAGALFGNALAGIVVFGSWARGEEGDSSDIDMLIVVDESVEIDREMYRRWDETPIVWDGLPVEPHFVHLPKSGAHVSGLWAEVAVDGMILFEREFAISKYLVCVREEIAAHRLIRRRVHGQSYWVKTARQEEAA